MEGVPGIPGRFQLIESTTQNFGVIVDYAHTPDSLINILTTAQEFAKGRINRIWLRWDRDRTKRPLMGKAAAQYSDFTIITPIIPGLRTSENYRRYFTRVKEICDSERYRVIVDRKEAIKEAIKWPKG